MAEPDGEARLRALLRLGREVSARHDLDDVLAETFRELRELVDFAGGSIQLLDDDGWITVAAADPPLSSDALQTRVPLGRSVAARVVLTERAVYAPDVTVDGVAPLLPSADWVAGVRCYFAVPLLADGRAIGVLRVDHERPDAFTRADQELLVAAAIIVAAAIQNARAHARSAAARSRSDMLENRIRRARSRLAEAQAMGGLPAQSRALLHELDSELADPPVGMELPIEAPHAR